MIKTCLIDLDDTLIPNAYSYYLPQLDAARIICIDLLWHAPSPSVMMKRAIEIQLEDIEARQCVEKGCFPRSWAQVYVEACKKANRAANEKIVGAIIKATERYFLPQYQVFEGAKQFLLGLAEGNIKKICVTRGDFDIQFYKIQSTLLEGYFDHIEIIPIKTVDTYCQILDKYQLLPQETAMVGDSLKNDIIPALQCGINAFHLTEDENKREWDDPDGLLKIPHLGQAIYQPVQTLNEVLTYLDKNSKNKQPGISV